MTKVPQQLQDNFKICLLSKMRNTLGAVEWVCHPLCFFGFFGYLNGHGVLDALSVTVLLKNIKIVVVVVGPVDNVDNLV